MTSKEAVKLAYIEFQKDLDYDENNQWLKNVIEGLKQAEKDLEVLEILKNKNVNICLIKDCYSLQDYNDTCIYLRSYSNQISKSILITKEEYDLLKEWIENGN